MTGMKLTSCPLKDTKDVYKLVCIFIVLGQFVVSHAILILQQEYMIQTNVVETTTGKVMSLQCSAHEQDCTSLSFVFDSTSLQFVKYNCRLQVKIATFFNPGSICPTAHGHGIQSSTCFSSCTQIVLATFSIIMILSLPLYTLDCRQFDTTSTCIFMQVVTCGQQSEFYLYISCVGICALCMTYDLQICYFHTVTFSVLTL